MLSLPPRVTSPNHWFWGPTYHVRRDPLKWIPRLLAEYGDIFRITSPLGQAVAVGSPELARQVLVDRYQRYQRKGQAYSVLRILLGDGLVTSEGEFWRGQRKLVQPAFHRRRLDAVFEMMVERVTECANRLALVAKSGQEVDMAPLLSQLALDIISRAMFSSDVHGAASDVSAYIAKLNAFALRMLRQPWLFLLPRKFPMPFAREQYHAFKSLNEIVHGIIQARRANPETHDDLLNMLLLACEEETGRGMTDEQLRDEVMTIFVAGHETTANAMAWLLYLISQNPDVEERLLAEVDAHWPEGGLTLETCTAFTFTREVIEESLRVYPSIWLVGRCCTEQDELGGFRIPTGTNVFIPIFHFHWSKRFWPEPHKFDPSRFQPERRPPPDPPVYFPFGVGPRSCIGNHFGLQELTIMTVVFFRHFQFRLKPGFVVEPDPLITLRPKHGMTMTLRLRQRSRAAAQAN